MNGMKQRRYTTEFKSQAIELVKLGKSVTEVARDLALSEGACAEKMPISNWRTTF
jgi:transposase-like protein